MKCQICNSLLEYSDWQDERDNRNGKCPNGCKPKAKLIPETPKAINQMKDQKMQMMNCDLLELELEAIDIELEFMQKRIVILREKRNIVSNSLNALQLDCELD